LNHFVLICCYLWFIPPSCGLLSARSVRCFTWYFFIIGYSSFNNFPYFYYLLFQLIFASAPNIHFRNQSLFPSLCVVCVVTSPVPPFIVIIILVIIIIGSIHHSFGAALVLSSTVVYGCCWWLVGGPKFTLPSCDRIHRLCYRSDTPSSISSLTFRPLTFFNNRACRGSTIIINYDFLFSICFLQLLSMSNGIDRCLVVFFCLFVFHFLCYCLVIVPFIISHWLSLQICRLGFPSVIFCTQ